MNQFAKTHSHALTLLKGSMEKKKANFYVEKGYPSLNHFLDQKHRTLFYGEIEMGVKKIKGNIQHHVHCSPTSQISDYTYHEATQLIPKTRFA